MEISGATTNRVVLDYTVFTKTIGYDIRVGLIFLTQIITVMKQTVSIFAPDINVASKSSAIQLWLNRKNQFFSSVLEEGVSNRQVLLCLAMPPLFSLH